MTNSPSPSAPSPATDNFLGAMKLIRIARAAELLGCTADQLLHFGAIGLLQIVAPVVASGDFAWPTEQGNNAFVDLDEPFVRYFDASSRVGIFPYDLAKIEAVGWAIPWRFYAPDYSREVIKHAPRSFKESLQTKNDQKRNNISQAKANALEKLRKGNLSEEETARLEYFVAPREDNKFLDEALDKGTWQSREELFLSAWVRADTPGEGTEKTTIEHLFITPEELFRLEEGLPHAPIFSEEELTKVPTKREHGNTRSNAIKRFETLFAAVWLHRKEISKLVKDGTAWTRELEINAPEFWKARVPPYKTRRTEAILRSVLDDDGIEKELHSKSDSAE